MSRRVLSVQEAREAVLAATLRLPDETIPCDEAAGRVLQEEIRAPHDFPAWDKSLMDGYAVIAADLRTAPVRLRVGQEIPAGADPGRLRPLESGTAARIMTGAPLPPHADAVLMVEDSAPAPGDPASMTANRLVRPGENIARRGDDLKRDALVLAPGEFIGAGEIAALAACGRPRVRVGGRPRVAILATGDELVEPDRTPAPGGLRNSNGPLLTALARRAGCDARYLGIAPDREGPLAKRIRAGLAADALVLSGGVSMGVYDLVGKTLRDLGVEILFDAVAVKPGKPFTFGRRGSTLVFGCPGNPVSTYVVFQTFVRPALRKMAGFAAPVPITLHGRLVESVRQRAGRTGYHQAVAAWRDDGWSVRVLPTSGSADFLSCARGNVLAIVPGDVERLEAGERVEFVPLDDFSER